MLLYLAKAGRSAIDGYFARFFILIVFVFHAIINEVEYQFIHFQSVFLLESEHRLMVEKERKRAGSTQIAVELVENRANVAHRSRRIVGECVYKYGHAMRPIPLVCHHFIFALVFTHRVFDSPFDVIFGHILAFRVGDDGPKCRVILWFGASCLYGNGNLFTYLCKRAGHMAPSFQFRSLAIFKCSSHRIVRLRASLCPYNIVAWKNKCNM